MLVSAWVITLGLDLSASERAVDAVAEMPGVDIGERFGNRLPVAVESETMAEQAAFYAAVRALKGVATVEMVLVDFEEHGSFDGFPVGLESPRWRRTQP